MDCGKFKLTYFDICGRAEIIRMVLKIAGKEFEDVRIKKEDWPAMKPSISTGMLPVLDTPCGKRMSQSIPIARFLAKKMNLYSDDEWEQYLIERAIAQVKDVSEELLKIYFAPEDKKEEVRKAFNNEKVRALLKVIVDFLGEREGGFFIGSKVTLADLFLMCCLDYLKVNYAYLLADFPKLQAHYDAVLQQKPILADWIKTRPVTSM